MSENSQENQGDTSELLTQIRRIHVERNSGADGSSSTSVVSDRSNAREIDRLDPVKAQDVHDRVSDRELKKYYARWFIYILIGQLLVMNGVMVSVGLGVLGLAESVLNLYMSGTMLEIFGIVLVITKYLFKRV